MYSRIEYRNPISKNTLSPSFYGYFMGLTPVIFLRDPDLIKQITHDDFEHFVDHQAWHDPAIEPLIGRSLFALKGDKWHSMRTTLSPAFGSGRVRAMFALVDQCAQRSVAALQVQAAATVEWRPSISDVLSRFAHDVIAGVAFGAEVNSIKYPDNAFYRLSMRALAFSTWRSRARVFLASLTCHWWPALRWRWFTDDIVQHYSALVLEAMKYRTAYGVQRADMIQLMLDARNGYMQQESDVQCGAVLDDDGQPPTTSAVEAEPGSEDMRGVRQRAWQDDDLTAQCFLFFMTGYWTIKDTLSFVIYELACNRLVQEKLRAEVDALRRRLNGRPLDYEDLDALVYMDMVIAETMRMRPITKVLQRQCVKDYRLCDAHGRAVDIRSGDIVYVPLAGLQLDAAHFDRPHAFDPERFGAERKHRIHAFTYLPFGTGPRKCMGQRFAVTELKAFVFYLLAAFSLERTETTPVPLRLKLDWFTMEMERPLDVRLVPHNGF